MNKFFKTVFASCLGAFLAFLALGALVFFFGIRAAMQGESGKKVSANSVLHLTLKNPIPELTNNSQVQGFELNTSPVLGLSDLLNAIDKAKDDNNIKGIVLEPKFMAIGQAQAKVIAEKLKDFSNDGKFVYANADFYTQGAYYLASGADKIYLNPKGSVDLRGYGAQIPFFKDGLDRLGVNAQVFYAGQFKSATEPFRRNEISDQNRLQIRELLDERYTQLLDMISQNRNIEKAQLKQLIDNYEIRWAEDAVTHGMVDSLVFKDQFESILRNKIGLEEDAKIKMVKLSDYYNPMTDKKSQSAKDKIAVVYAEGGIVDGDDRPGVIEGDKYAEVISDLRKDESIKAIVLRINSGGGSGFASEKILREVKVCQENGIPVVASFADVAASGGYYIATSTDSIFAEPNSITGSIGVFGVIPSVQKMMADKLGITFDTVTTSKYAVGFTPFRDLNADEGKIIQEYIDDFYEDFLAHVAEGRNMTRDQVHEIAQGRVWTGNKALENGLVDALGGLPDALDAAASLAGLKDYKVREFPKVKTPFEQLFEELTGGNAMAKEKILQSELGENFKHYEWLKSVAETKGPQARIPFLIE
ncbi:MAG: signal peptide peptidase SppA [Saprospiraceae bacterium]|nr:signal peptide peptidase SppA [Saprospiraceae bacterium]